MHRFNNYSWFLVLGYIATVLVMEYHSYAVPWESLYATSPLILLFVLWSEKTTRLFKTNDNITKYDAFNRDLFLISYSFLVGELLSCLLAYKVSDVRAWWSLGVVVIALFGFLFALLFSLAALLLDNHKKYTIVFGFLILISLPFFSSLAHQMPLSWVASDYFFYGSNIFLLIIHLLICFGYKIRSLTIKAV